MNIIENDNKNKNNNENNDDFSNIMGMLSPKEPKMPVTHMMSAPPKPPVAPVAPGSTDVLSQMQATLDSMKKQLDEMRAQHANAQLQISQGNDEAALVIAEIDSKVHEKQNELGELLKTNINHDTNLKAIANGMSVSKFGFSKEPVITSTSFYCTSMDQLDEDGLAAALEPFTNPRRIKLLKVLMEKILPANEISQATGLVGGQLYHHLQNLESAGLIVKMQDKYMVTPDAKSTLCMLYSAIGGTKIARNTPQEEDVIRDEEQEIIHGMHISEFRDVKINDLKILFHQKDGVLEAQVILGENNIKLSPKELGILYYLILNMNTVLTRDQILGAVWGNDYVGDAGMVDAHIKSIKEKLDSTKSLKEKLHGASNDWNLKIILGVGYKFEKLFW